MENTDLQNDNFDFEDDLSYGTDATFPFSQLIAASEELDLSKNTLTRSCISPNLFEVRNNIEDKNDNENSNETINFDGTPNENSNETIDFDGTPPQCTTPGRFETPIGLRSNTFKPLLSQQPQFFEPKPISPNQHRQILESEDYKVLFKAIRKYGKDSLRHNETIVDSMFQLHLKAASYEHHEFFPPIDDAMLRDAGNEGDNYCARFRVAANSNNRCSSSYSDLTVSYF